MIGKTNWATKLAGEMAKHGESLDSIVANTMSVAEMETMFCDGFGSSEGCPFTVWTRLSVYFPVVYDGAEYVGRVARHPDGKPTKHQGGE